MGSYISPMTNTVPHRGQRLDTMEYYKRFAERLVPEHMMTLEEVGKATELATYDFLGKYVIGGIDDYDIDDYDELQNSGEVPTFISGGLVLRRIMRNHESKRSAEVGTIIINGVGVPTATQETFGLHDSGLLYRPVSSELLLIGYLARGREAQEAIDVAIQTQLLNDC